MSNCSYFNCQLNLKIIYFDSYLIMDLAEKLCRMVSIDDYFPFDSQI